MSAAVSLSDAWNDPPAVSADDLRAATVSARPTRTIPAAVPVESTSYEESDLVANEGPALQPEIGRLESQLLEEFRLMRAEGSRRCTVYLVIVGVLFALLFVYIDRLQTQIKVMNQLMIVRTPHMQNPYAPRTSIESQDRWYG